MHPVAYLLTFTTYGSWLHGDPRGSHRHGRGYQPPDERLFEYRRAQLTQSPVVLCERRRAIVLAAIVETCSVRAWPLAAAHVRPEHVHVVVAGDSSGKMLGSLKAWSTRRLREAELVGASEKVWTDSGSVVPLWSGEECEAAAVYVHERQGEVMARHP